MQTDDLTTLRRCAHLLGVHETSLCRWRKLPGAPAKHGRLESISEWQRWIENRRAEAEDRYSGSLRAEKLRAQIKILRLKHQAMLARLVDRAEVDSFITALKETTRRLELQRNEWLGDRLAGLTADQIKPLLKEASDRMFDAFDATYQQVTNET